jgi:hypothetical protein
MDPLPRSAKISPRQESEASPASSAADAKPAIAAEKDVPLWLRRLSLIVFVLCCLEIGLLLVVLPWTTIWTENSLLVGYPRLQTFVQQNFVRGLVSGLGLLDIWLGIWEALHYRERRQTD